MPQQQRPKQALRRGAPGDDIVSLFDRALACHREGRLAEAEAIYQTIIARQPTHFDSQHLVGVIYHQRGEHGAAVRQIDTALALNPNSVVAHSNRGSALKELGRFEEALASYDRALAIRPQHPEVLFNRGSVLQQLARNDEALACFDRALAIKPDYPEALINRGSVLQELKRLDDALACYDAALRLNPRYAQAHNNRGTVLAQLDRPSEALTAYDIAVAIKGDYAEAHYNRGQVLRDMGRLDAALLSFDRAIALRPDYAEATFHRAATLGRLERFDEALTSYDQAIALKPNYPEALLNRGWILVERSRLSDALADYDRTIALNPDCADAHFSRGIALERMSRLDEALSSYDRAMALDCGQKYLEGMRLRVKMLLCDWHDFDADCARLCTSVAEGRIAATPFLLLPIPSTPALQRQCAATYVADKCPAVNPLWTGERYHHDRIRVAYLSADFHDHATAHLMAGVFESHDRTRFETTAVSFGPDKDGDMRRRLKQSFDRFVDVRADSERAIAELVRDLEIDIAVDLKGFTQGSRTGIFARRPAPVQVSYLGFPGTMGASYIDYIIADHFLVPQDQRNAYTENVVYLPDSYQPNDRNRRIADRTPSRADVGLPDDGFVFCSFNHAYKITPSVFDIWMRLLRQVDGSVLWLLEANSAAPDNLRREAKKRGVAPKRLVFAPLVDIADHLARQRLADLFLDTFPVNAHTTASDALWVGLPLITCPGTTFVSRVAGSLLNAVGLPELITGSPVDYETLALKLARNPNELAALKQKLIARRDICAAFDTERLTRHIEAAYITMWERSQHGEAPRSFSIAPIPSGLPG